MEREKQRQRRERKGSFRFIEKGEIGLRDKERWCERKRDRNKREEGRLGVKERKTALGPLAFWVETTGRC